MPKLTHLGCLGAAALLGANAGDGDAETSATDARNHGFGVGQRLRASLFRFSPEQKRCVPSSLSSRPPSDREVIFTEEKRLQSCQTAVCMERIGRLLGSRFVIRADVGGARQETPPDAEARKRQKRSSHRAQDRRG